MPRCRLRRGDGGVGAAARRRVGPHRRRPSRLPGAADEATGRPGRVAPVSPKGSDPDIRAAGGVVWRARKSKVEVALVHRPRYDDWSLPKGKLHEGETELAGAAREVAAEIGARVAVSRRIGEISYDVATARKTVGYWVMRHLAGEFVPNDEVDKVEWLRPK